MRSALSVPPLSAKRLTFNSQFKKLSLRLLSGLRTVSLAHVWLWGICQGAGRFTFPLPHVKINDEHCVLVDGPVGVALHLADALLSGPGPRWNIGRFDVAEFFCYALTLVLHKLNADKRPDQIQ